MPCDTVRRRLEIQEPAKVQTAFEAIERALASGRVRVSTDSLGRPIIEGWIPEVGYLKTAGMTDLCICAAIGTRQSLAWKQATTANPRLKNVVEMHAAAHRAGGHH